MMILNSICLNYFLDIKVVGLWSVMALSAARRPREIVDVKCRKLHFVVCIGRQ